MPAAGLVVWLLIRVAIYPEETSWSTSPKPRSYMFCTSQQPDIRRVEGKLKLPQCQFSGAKFWSGPKSCRGIKFRIFRCSPERTSSTRGQTSYSSHLWSDWPSNKRSVVNGYSSCKKCQRSLKCSAYSISTTSVCVMPARFNDKLVILFCVVQMQFYLRS